MCHEQPPEAVGLHATPPPPLPPPLACRRRCLARCNTHEAALPLVLPSDRLQGP